MKAVYHVTTPLGTDVAKVYILQCQKQHPTAAHHCWAYIAGPLSDFIQWELSGDVEPSGAAGKPMFTQLSESDLAKITTEAVQHYNGIHLGSGGPIKAYNGIQQTLKQALSVVRDPRRRFVLRRDYLQLAGIKDAVQQVGGLIIEGGCQESIILTLKIHVHHIATANDRLRDLSSSALQLTPVSQQYLPPEGDNR